MSDIEKCGESHDFNGPWCDLPAGHKGDHCARTQWKRHVLDASPREVPEADPSDRDESGEPFPRTNYALWDEHGTLTHYRKFEEGVSASLFIRMVGPLLPYTIAEFNEEKWADLMQRIEDGLPTDKASVIG